MIPRFIARQFSCPRGLLGRLVGRMMNKGNARLNAFAVQQLQLTASDRVLEIGFGGGVVLASFLASARTVTGVDRSRTAVAMAKAKFAGDVAARRAIFLEADVEILPFAEGSFDKVCTVHTVYFWRSLDDAFREIYRVMSPHGRLAVGFLPGERMARMGLPGDIFTLRAPTELIESVTRAGFSNADLQRPSPATVWNVLLATR